MSVENKETLSLDEFKAWLAGLIRGKNGQIPNIDDWKLIKRMLDRVVEKQVVKKDSEDSIFDENEIWRYKHISPLPPYQQQQWKIEDSKPYITTTTSYPITTTVTIKNDDSETIESAAMQLNAAFATMVEANDGNT